MHLQVPQTSESALIVTDYSTLHYHHYMLLWQSHLIQSCCISITYHHGSTKRYQKLGTTRHTIEQRLVVERTRTTQVLPNITIINTDPRQACIVESYLQRGYPCSIITIVY